MVNKSLAWTTAVITGGAGGLGRAMAAQFIKEGKQVILVGRTESSLKKAADEFKAKAYYVADVGKYSEIDGLAKTIIKDHPEVDCLINNAGIQKPINFSKEVNDDDWLQEININIIGVLKLIEAFVPHFKSKPNAAIINIASGLAYVPLNAVPVYCATKAFIKSFTMSLRYQLKDTSVAVIEISPPMVETALHRDHEDPNNNKVSQNKESMTQADFIKEVFEDLNNGFDEIGAGFVKHAIKGWRGAFNDTYGHLNPDATGTWQKA